MAEIVKAEDRAFLCAQRKGVLCMVKRHAITSGVASIEHCGDCKKFIDKRTRE